MCVRPTSWCQAHPAFSESAITKTRARVRFCAIGLYMRGLFRGEGAAHAQSPGLRGNNSHELPNRAHRLCILRAKQSFRKSNTFLELSKKSPWSHLRCERKSDRGSVTTRQIIATVRNKHKYVRCRTDLYSGRCGTSRQLGERIAESAKIVAAARAGTKASAHPAINLGNR
jgi:hypothetical protein